MGEDATRPQRPPARRLAELVVDQPALRPFGPAEPAGVTVTGVSVDSRQIRSGDLYIARAGERTHGIEHLDAALAAGAVAVLTDPVAADVAARAGVPVLIGDDPRSVAGAVAAWVYGDPSASLLLLGVTGTNGKTTTTWLLDAGLRAAGRRTGLLGTVATVIDGERRSSVRTTPEATEVQALLAVMVERGVDAVAMEVSSHALALGRVAGCRFDVAGFTNLSQDHLDFHGDMDGYFAAKRSLFTPELSDRAVVTVDDAWGRKLADRPTVPTVTLGSADADWVWSGRSGHLQLDRAGRRLEAEVALPGRFNLANAAIAIAILAEAGVDPAVAAAGVATLPAVPGRMQPVNRGQPFMVLVDYAHTPEAVARALAEVRELTEGRVTVVLGCGGDRDAGKRPLMGRAASYGADRLVITDDNPRWEDPDAIRAAMRAGATGPAEVTEIADRRAAITSAVRDARPGDVVLIAGKGHETGREQAGIVTPFDDAVVAADVLQRLVPDHRRPPEAAPVVPGDGG